MKESCKRYKECLDAIHEDCQKHGKISNIADYARTYGVNRSVGTILVQSGVLKRNKHDYTWQRRQPDQAMAIKVLDDLNAYWKNHQTKKTKTNQSSAVSNYVSQVNLDEFLDAFDMLPKSLTRNEKKKVVKEMIEWKHS